MTNAEKFRKAIEEANDQITSKVKEAENLLHEAKNLSDKFGVEFSFGLFCSRYTPLKVDRDVYPELSDDEYELFFGNLPIKTEYCNPDQGWTNSSMDC